MATPSPGLLPPAGETPDPGRALRSAAAAAAPRFVSPVRPQMVLSRLSTQAGLHRAAQTRAARTRAVAWAGPLASLILWLPLSAQRRLPRQSPRQRMPTCS
jgi:hypothetical protein